MISPPRLHPCNQVLSEVVAARLPSQGLKAHRLSLWLSLPLALVIAGSAQIFLCSLPTLVCCTSGNFALEKTLYLSSSVYRELCSCSSAAISLHSLLLHSASLRTTYLMNFSL